ncbi:MAG: UDP-N-acetylglucosamine 2-epimerase (non-hydrolyzing) [Paludibacteraceae bacterium]|nr:UDP-N-acetylglucosamine 2-epimerase (non-hydrolyzing) [Paludibacteraceae bacterium]
MLHLLTIIGARPQIIKAAAISRAIRNRFADQVQETILHTGQHYDENMSGSFFSELGIPQPDVNLHVGSGSHGVQTSKMIEGIEQELMGQGTSAVPYDGIILYGDTNSTLAGAVAAGKIHVPIFHIEAGLRSHNMAMPEEQNRIVCDHLSSILFAPTHTAVDNLQKEGIVDSPRHFRNGKGQRVVQSGDVMYDNSMYFAEMAEQKSDILQRLNLAKGQFVLATIHRPQNTDSEVNLSNIFRALADIADHEQTKIVVPLHPRTRKLLPEKLSPELLTRIQQNANIVLTEPAGFFDIICLEKFASIVMTDSGGVQKEAFFFGTPCVILRPETEWVEIVEAGAGILTDADYDKIMEAYGTLKNLQVTFPPLFGNAHASEQIIQAIIDYLR